MVEVGTPLGDGVRQDEGVERAGDAAHLGFLVLVGTVAVLTAAALVRTGGTFVYVLDDPAIHLTLARRLAYDGTWGVTAGEFQAASSSPLWTLLLAPTQWVARGTAGELVPLVLNVAAALGVLRLLRPELAVLRPSRHRPLDVVAVAALVVGPLFLPGLAFVGMEHCLHMLLVLAAALAAERRWVTGGGTGGRWWVPGALVALATFTRGETAFVAVGLAVALVAVGHRRWAGDGAGPAPAGAGDVDRGPGGGAGGAGPRGPASLRTRMLAGVGLGAAAGGALAVVAAVNLAFGQSILPNSVILKSVGDRGDTRRSPAAALERLLNDPWLALVIVMALVVLVAAARHRWLRGAVFPAVVVAVVAALHVELAAVTPSLRYEAYVGGLGTWLVLRVLGLRQAAPVPDGKASGGRRRWGRRPLSAAAAVVLLVPAAALQMKATAAVPRHAETLWTQRYQVALFLGEHYRHEAVAIGELGYIGLYHDGPLTDIYGLADHTVLWATLAGRKDASFWRALQRRRGFRVVVAYDFALGDVPDEWFPVADWRVADVAFPVTRFWATVPGEVAPLLDALRSAEADQPDGVSVHYNPLVELAAARP